jgi:hypothetical protein
MSNQTDKLEIQDAKDFILAELKDLKKALNRNDFAEIMQICDWIARECEEIIDNN